MNAEEKYSLLELSANAMGFRIISREGGSLVIERGDGGDYRGWNPLEWDVNAFELMVALKMEVRVTASLVAAEAHSSMSSTVVSLRNTGGDVNQATRLAITQEAANVARKTLEES